MSPVCSDVCWGTGHGAASMLRSRAFPSQPRLHISSSLSDHVLLFLECGVCSSNGMRWVKELSCSLPRPCLGGINLLTPGAPAPYPCMQEPGSRPPAGIVTRDTLSLGVGLNARALWGACIPRGGEDAITPGGQTVVLGMPVPLLSTYHTQICVQSRSRYSI